MEKSLATMNDLLPGKDSPAVVYSKVDVVTKANVGSLAGHRTWKQDSL